MNKNWIRFFSMTAGRHWAIGLLLSCIRRLLIRMSCCEGERMELYAILLASEVMYAREDLGADQCEDEMHEADNRLAAEVVLENLGETMHKLLGERLTMILHYRETGGPFGEFGTHGGVDL
jgi:hypothetical protein